MTGIANRLKYIIENENVERAMAGAQPIIYDENAVNYIARLAQGGMRDSITTLEKCLEFISQLEAFGMPVPPEVLVPE